jgi:glycosyltransferase involved in cell wall biosynthesis
MMVRDEEDVIGYVLEHLVANVDHIYVSDNRSVDATPEIAVSFPQVSLMHDPEIAYEQSRKMTTLAQVAFKEGHEWVVPCDADEVWYHPGGRSLSDFLSGVGRDVQVVRAALYNHWPTSLDDDDIDDPTQRITWRQRSPGALPKVCARLNPDLVIHMGNHAATYGYPALTARGLEIRHFSWRTEDQYLRKIRNGVESYRETEMDESIGEHWRMWEDHDDETIRAHFRRWFFIEDPLESDILVNDRCPTGGRHE